MSEVRSNLFHSILALFVFGAVTPAVVAQPTAPADWTLAGGIAQRDTSARTLHGCTPRRMRTEYLSGSTDLSIRTLAHSSNSVTAISLSMHPDFVSNVEAKGLSASATITMAIAHSVPEKAERLQVSIKHFDQTDRVTKTELREIDLAADAQRPVSLDIHSDVFASDASRRIEVVPERWIAQKLTGEFQSIESVKPVHLALTAGHLRVLDCRGESSTAT